MSIINTQVGGSAAGGEPVDMAWFTKDGHAIPYYDEAKLEGAGEFVYTAVSVTRATLQLVDLWEFQGTKMVRLYDDDLRERWIDIPDFLNIVWYGTVAEGRIEGEWRYVRSRYSTPKLYSLQHVAATEAARKFTLADGVATRMIKGGKSGFPFA